MLNLQHDSVEQVFVLIKWEKKDKFLIDACYILPNGPISCYYVHTKTVEWILNKYTFYMNLILYGNYKLPQVRFTCNDIGSICNGHTSTRSEMILDFFSSLNLH